MVSNLELICLMLQGFIPFAKPIYHIGRTSKFPSQASVLIINHRCIHTYITLLDGPCALHSSCSACCCRCFAFLFTDLQSHVVLTGQVKQYFACESQHQHGAFDKTGGFKYFLFSPLLQEESHFDEHMFQRG